MVIHTTKPKLSLLYLCNVYQNILHYHAGNYANTVYDELDMTLVWRIAFQSNLVGESLAN